MSRRIVWLRALGAGSVGIAVVGLWAGAILWQGGSRPGGAATAVLGALLGATFLHRLRELTRATRRSSAVPPAA